MPITKVLFNESDNKLLDYLEDDGFTIEPKYYIPIIPMILVNGSEGIGTGYSTNIPCYNPDEIIANLKLLIDSDGKAEQKSLFPWYRGFKGTIEENEGKFITTGVYKVSGTTVEVTELPIGKWTQTYKEFLESLVETNEIIDYRNNCDDTNVSFKVVMQKTVIDQLVAKNEMVKKLKLTSVINTTNMHVFDENCKIRKVTTPEEIIYRFYKVRKGLYIKRKEYLIKTLNESLKLLDAKIKFIELIISEQIVVFNKKKDFIVKQIESFNLLKINETYDYLLDLKLWTLTAEKIEALKKEAEKMHQELEKLESTTISQMWKSELMNLNF